MFDFAWSEIGLIAAVALILIGPKDMPVAIRTITDMIKKARRMASEFQTHVDEMVREANLTEVRDQISSLRNFDLKRELERHIDPDRTIRDTFSDNPLAPSPAPTYEAGSEHVIAAPAPESDTGLLEPDPAAATTEIAEPTPHVPAAPAFVPPGFVAPENAAQGQDEAPAFIPPQAVLERRSRASA
jgi:sec-independent protein translocase protein TatB